MDVSFEQRLLRFLDREDEDEVRSARELRALSIDDRVLEGECIANALLKRMSGSELIFAVEENVSKFRARDALVAGDGVDFESAARLAYVEYRPEAGELILEPDRFDKSERPSLAVGETYCIDRRSLGLRGRLHEVVRTSFADPRIAAVFEGRPAALAQPDAARFERAVQALATTELNDAQVQAGAAAIATGSLALVQGPPGTGKTRLLAEVLKALCAKGTHVVLSSFTHRAVDNALIALRRLDPELPLFKLGYPGANAQALRVHGVRTAPPRQARLDRRGGVIAGTCFAVSKLPRDARFHVAVFDEAGQLPIPHAMVGMLRAKNWLFFGDHAQLAPVITAQHSDPEVTRSVFEFLHARFGSELLDTTYRMNQGVCELVSRLFYGGRLKPAPEAAARRMPFVPGGKLDELLDPEQPVVFARVDHHQPGDRSVEEAGVCVDIASDLLHQHGVPPQEIAFIAPFRAQVRTIRTALLRNQLPVGDRGITVDTVERIQGQERDVIVLSLAVGDPATLAGRASFFFSTNRLNVALSRARTKAVVVASPGAFRALPPDPDALRAAAVFKELVAELPQVDLTAVYA